MWFRMGGAGWIEIETTRNDREDDTHREDDADKRSIRTKHHIIEREREAETW